MDMQKINLVLGSGISLRGDEIDTDRIIPARFLKCISFSGIEKNVFCDDRQQLKDEGSVHSFDQEYFQQANILVANKNFGCGSSREHAPQALLRWGIEIVLAEGFSEIFLANSVAIGMPCIVLKQKEIEHIQGIVEQNPSSSMSVDLEKKELKIAEKLFSFNLDNSVQKSFLGGTWDSTSTLLKNKEFINKIAEEIPYIQW